MKKKTTKRQKDLNRVMALIVGKVLLHVGYYMDELNFFFLYMERQFVS